MIFALIENVSIKWPKYEIDFQSLTEFYCNGRTLLFNSFKIRIKTAYTKQSWIYFSVQIHKKCKGCWDKSADYSEDPGIWDESSKISYLFKMKNFLFEILDEVFTKLCLYVTTLPIL